MAAASLFCLARNRLLRTHLAIRGSPTGSLLRLVVAPGWGHSHYRHQVETFKIFKLISKNKGDRCFTNTPTKIIERNTHQI